MYMHLYLNVKVKNVTTKVVTDRPTDRLTHKTNSASLLRMCAEIPYFIKLININCHRKVYQLCLACTCTCTLMYV